MNETMAAGKNVLLTILLALLLLLMALPFSLAQAQEATGDYYTMKYDSQGKVLWSRAYDGGLWDYGYGVAADSEGNIIVTGASEIWHDYNGNEEQEEGEINYDYYTIKYDSDGNEIWHAIYDGEARDEAFAVAVDFDDNVIVTGRSFNGKDYDYCTIKYDPKGNEIWSEPILYDGGDTDCANSVAVDSKDNIIVTGYSNNETLDYRTIKYDSLGQVVAGWPVIYDSGFTDSALEVAASASDDSILVTGVGGETKDFCTIKYDPEGKEAWPEPVFYNIGPDNTSDTAFGLAIDTQGSIIVIGSYSISREGQIFPKWHGYTTIRYDSDGNTIEGWPVTYDGEHQECAYHVAVDPRDNSIIVTGKASDDKTWNYHTIKYNSKGIEQWHQVYDGGQWDSALSVTVDPNGNIIVTGSSQCPKGSSGAQPTIALSSSGFSFSATESGADPPSQTLDVWNSGSGTLNWFVNDGATWLSLTPTSGSSTGEHDTASVSADIFGMTTGDYTAAIIITAPEANNSPQEITVTLHIEAPLSVGLSGGVIAAIVVGSLIVGGLMVIFFRQKVRSSKPSK